MHRPALLCCLAVLLGPSLLPAADDPTRVFPPDKPSTDRRLGKPIDLNGYFPFTPPKTAAEWAERRQAVREQVLLANGLLPLPEKTPLAPVVHGGIDRGDYTVEKVSFASMPGHYVTGNLYRPKGKGPFAGVLCPHGHWRDGRFYDAGEAAAKAQIAKGAEADLSGARYPLQARCATLARLGCIVFHYDMVGYADSTAIVHREGFKDAEAELRLQSVMGLQTWNSIRALDFLLSIKEVDRDRVGVTGASGGGTQTFVLCGVDDRPAAAFPAVMVSTAMQGGCVCENASYLRVGTGNIELAGLFAPKPLAMSGANDWTKEIETKGLPELKALYKTLGAEANVKARCWPEFEHNYNQPARELMYAWFNEHLKLGHTGAIQEKPFEPIAPKDLSVYDAEHPRPKDELPTEKLRHRMTESAEKQAATLTADDLRTALRAMVGGGLPANGMVESDADQFDLTDGLRGARVVISRKGSGEQVPAIALRGKDYDGTLVVWVHPKGKSSLFAGGKLAPEARAILDAKGGILAIDCLRTGEAGGDKPAPAVDKNYAGYTFGYNRPLLADRVRDILSAVAAARAQPDVKRIHLVGWGEAGPWAVLARGLCGDAVTRTAADCNGFRFEKVTDTNDPMLLPGALKYGGLPAFASLAAPGELWLSRFADDGRVAAAFKKASAEGKLKVEEGAADGGKVVGWLLR
jgi:dienelactone hydrolase